MLNTKCCFWLTGILSFAQCAFHYVNQVIAFAVKFVVDVACHFGDCIWKCVCMFHLFTT